MITSWLTPWTRVPPEKLTVIPLVKKFLIFIESEDILMCTNLISCSILKYDVIMAHLSVSIPNICANVNNNSMELSFLS
jgi:hypothetical protein